MGAREITATNTTHGFWCQTPCGTGQKKHYVEVTAMPVGMLEIF